MMFSIHKLIFGISENKHKKMVLYPSKVNFPNLMWTDTDKSILQCTVHRTNLQAWFAVCLQYTLRLYTYMCVSFCKQCQNWTKFFCMEMLNLLSWNLCRLRFRFWRPDKGHFSFSFPYCKSLFGILPYHNSIYVGRAKIAPLPIRFFFKNWFIV